MFFTQNENKLDTLMEKWQGVLNVKALPSIRDYHRRAVTTVLLENQVKALKGDLAGASRI